MKKFLIKSILIVCVIFIIIVSFVNDKSNSKELENNLENKDKTELVQKKEDNNEENDEHKIQKEIITNYKGYEVIAKLEIPKINLNSYVLKKHSIEALNTSCTKFWGSNPNEVGNFCIAGHNFKNMFYDLKWLEINDELFIKTNENGKYKYKIYDIFKVFPNDTRCLNQDTSGKKEVTLITCTMDSKQRIIIKALEEVNKK